MCLVSSNEQLPWEHCHILNNLVWFYTTVIKAVSVKSAFFGWDAESVMLTVLASDWFWSCCLLSRRQTAQKDLRCGDQTWLKWLQGTYDDYETFLIPLMIVNDLWQIRDHVCARVWSQVKYNTTSHHESFCGLSVTCRHHKLAKAFTTAGVITCLSKGGARNNNSWKVLCRHLNLSFYPITPALYCRVTWKSFWASGTLFLSCLAELLKARPARSGTFWNHKRKRKTHKAQF